MALRVLLADESTSIKKVMQLALQDFGVEVKAVPVGLDVVPVAKSWNPDIVFVDVLLAKKSGYEVCSELRADAQLSKVPVVLIWSSFMDIDENKASSCGAVRRLEKPFDAETLRGIIKDLVPNTSSNAISGYLSFPHLPDFIEKKKPVAPPNEVEEPEDFSQVPLPNMNKMSAGQTTEPWTSGNLDRFKINFPTDDLTQLDMSFASLEESPIALTGSGGGHEVQLGDLDDVPGSTSRPPAAVNSSLDPAYIEQILREQVRAVLQDIGWKIIPDLAERIVREEIQKLLKDAEKLS